MDVLRHFYDYLEEHGRVDSNPARALARQRPHPLRRSYPRPSLTKEEQRTLEAAVGEHSRSSDKERNLAIVTLFMEQGLTTQELCALTPGDIYFDAKGVPVELTVTGVKGKRRGIRLTRRSRRALTAWLCNPAFKETEGEVRSRYYQEQRYVRQQRLFEFDTDKDDKDLTKTAEVKPPQGLWLITAHRRKGWPLEAHGVRHMVTRFGRLAGIGVRLPPARLRKG